MAQQRTDESRRYRILDVVGEGGFGKVYRARLEGAEGFAKDVAIKLLTDSEAPEEVLQRFRDESRILGLIRDRAIVTVDPPTRLDGRWAVVMEFVDGTNCERLLRANPIPPRPAVEIVQEVARALDNVYNQPGPDGEPLCLIHRDIKPGNIQVTPSGAVKILDFGIARAQFASRESRTTTHIGGTFGYIAPERLEGVDGPAADVYSLGVVLAALICGRRPTAKTREKVVDWVSKDPDLQKVWDIAMWMQTPEPDERPTAREVEDRCAEVVNELRGGALRRWAEREVHDLSLTNDDRLVGSVLTETMAYLPRFDTEDAALALASRTDLSPRRNPWILAIVASVGAAAVLLGVIGLSLAVGYLAANSGQSTSTVEVPILVPENDGVVDPTVEPEPEPEPVVEPEPEPEPEPEVEPEPEPEPVASPSPAPVRPRPKPKPKPEPPPQPAAATMPITFGSIPVGAKVFVDGKFIGKTAIVGHPVPEGAHEIQMWLGEEKASRNITVGKRSPVRYIWKGGSEWQVFY
ncbi:MAG: serine/threonine protein kinase [Alphaproteobacteria bacterium]|nr:serine/threonine protein kinase [Alphaproteobacteria bacterium]